MRKTLLRQQARSKRDGLNGLFRAEASREIQRSFLRWVRQSGCDHVGLYAELGSEPSVASLAEPLWDEGITVSFPRVTLDRPGKMEFVSIQSLHELQPGYRGVLEPNTTGSSREPMVILMPGLAFGRDGGRLGYGGGVYDSYLNRRQTVPIRIGVCFENAILDTLPMEDHDVPVDGILSEKGLFWR